MKKKARMQGENTGEQTERGQPASDTGSSLPGSSGEAVSWMSRHLGLYSGIRFTAPEKLSGLVGKETASEPNLHRNQFHTAIIQGNRAAGMTFILLFKI